MAAQSASPWKLFFVIICVLQVVSAGTIVCLRSHNELCIQGVTKATSLAVNYESFLGIPYAKPPFDQLRFANPVRNDPWTGIYDATQPKPPCIQRNEVFPFGDVLGSEDCLYLNVYRPQDAEHSLPVLVYIYGGAFQSGSADPTVSGPERLMNGEDVILVTISYRVGALGFLSTGDSEAPGNFGLKDQSMAIRWVRKHIHKFGGNKHKITVFGESSGAASVQYHMMSPLSRGNFSRAILMSGSALALYARPHPDPLQIARLQAGVLGLTPYDTLTSSEVITFLRSIPAAELVGSFDLVKQTLGLANSITVYRPVIEQYVEGQSFLHDSPLTLWTSCNYEKIPLMVGHVPNEWIVLGRTLLDLMADPSQISSIIASLPNILSQSLGLDLTQIPAVMQHYYPSLNLATIMPSDILNLANNLINQVQFEYPMMKTVTQHLQCTDPSKAPASVYFLKFAGPYTLSSFFLPGSTYPIGHSDDLQYVLNMPALFSDFPFGSPGFFMTTKLVNIFLEFARTGRALPSYLGTCPSLTNCKQIEFSNGLSGLDPVEVQLTDALNTVELNFLNGLYNSP